MAKVKLFVITTLGFVLGIVTMYMFAIALINTEPQTISITLGKTTMATLMGLVGVIVSVIVIGLVWLAFDHTERQANKPPYKRIEPIGDYIQPS